MNKTELDNIGTKIVDAAYSVHKELVPGLLESVYEFCLNKEFIIDLLVENEIIIELKAVEIVLPVHEVQLLTYMKLADKKLGYLINFNVPIIKEGIKRKINGYFN